MSLLATSYRYEKMTAKPGLVRALSRQTERVQNDELFAAREKESRSNAQVNLMSEWSENLEFKVAAKRGVLQGKQADGELKCAQKASLMVRQAALRKILDEEYRKYQLELNAKGKTFYIKRT